MSAVVTQGMPPEIAVELARLGRVIDPVSTAALYASLQEPEPYDDVIVMRDIAYGDQARQRLDLFASTVPGERKRKPVLMFVHGGGFSSGDKHIPGSPFYDNVTLWAARNGFVGVNLTYRLVPQAVWPGGAEDVGSALRWVLANIGRHGGDPARVYLMGHSAGAVHVAGYISHPRLHVKSGSGLAGAILISGLYDLMARQIMPPELAYFGADTACHAERSSLAGLLEQLALPPLLLAAAELDPPVFLAEFEGLREALAKAGNAEVRSLILPQHSHLSEVFSINTADTMLSNAIAAFAQTV